MRRRLLCKATGVSALALVVFVVSSQSREAKNAETAADIVQPASAPIEPATSLGQRQFKQRIRIWVHPNEVRPRMIAAQPGPAVLTIEKLTETEVAVHIERVRPNRTQPLGGVTIAANVKRLNREVVLEVGEYVIYEASQPEIRTRLSVAPRD